MKSTFSRRIFALLTALVMILCSCRQPPEPSSSAPEGPTEEGLAAQKLLDTLTETAEIYDFYCNGGDLPPADSMELAGFAYGWLRRYDLRERFGRKQEDGSVMYTIPQPFAGELCRLFFDADITQGSQHYELNYFDVFDADPAEHYTLRGPDALPAMAADGSYEISFERVGKNGAALVPVTYTFSPYILTDTPTAPISSRYSEGETLYRITRVKNTPQAVLKKEDFLQESISTTDELLELAKRINSGDRAVQQKRYLLQNDLDLSGIPFEPIGKNRPVLDGDRRDDSFSGFCAVFDGQGHTISNMKIEAEYNGGEPVLDTGFFSLIGAGGEVRNLKLENAVIKPRQLDSGAANYLQRTGLLAGSCAGVIESCTVSGSVKGGYEVGGLVGAIGNYDDYGERESFARVTGCKVNASVAGESEIGVFAGRLHGAFVTDCTAEGEVVAVSGSLYDMPRAIGGFAGFSVEGIIEGCDSSCYVKTMVPSAWVGAFMGYNQGEIHSSRYNLDRAPFWEPVDVIYHGAASGVTAYSKNVVPRAALKKESDTV